MRQNDQYERATAMTESTFRYLCLIPASVIISDPDTVPDAEGVYYAFVKNGLKLLRDADYFNFNWREPLTHENDAHLYTGASRNMRSRVICHLRGGADQSGLRKTLVALEYARNALSGATTPAGPPITDRRALNEWMAEAMNFAFVPCADSRRHERRLLASIVSPLNLRGQKTLDYARQLLKWRAQYRPRHGSF
jgi:hypothetical protein